MPHKRTANEPIGTCPCPFSNCDEVGTLHKYRAYSDDPARQRRAGRLYMRCDTHGMIQDQEWLLENGHIDTPAPALDIEPNAEIQTETPPAPKKDAAKSPVPAEPEPGKATPSPKTADDAAGDTWGFFA